MFDREALCQPAGVDASAHSPGAAGAVVLAVRFGCELATLVALAVAGARSAGGAGGVLLAVAAPVLFAVVWGAVVAPRAARRLPDPARLLLELVLFGAACGWLAATGSVGWALVLAVLSVATALLTRRLAPGG